VGGGPHRLEHLEHDRFKELGLKALETVTVETGPNPTFTIIWMHGLGADGHDFEPLVPELLEDGMPVLRFVFPHAPVRPVTINNGYPMRAWYDIIGIDRRSAEDFAGIKASADAVSDLIEAENQRGVATARVAIAGFSQGGAMALHVATRHPEKLAGVIALSCYLPQSRELATAKSAANQATPIFMAHGFQDPVVPYTLGDDSRQLLQAAGYAVEWHSYPMPHSLCEPEVSDIRAFLKRVTVA
jgi:phospholipase/carboxylesterase